MSLNDVQLLLADVAISLPRNTTGKLLRRQLHTGGGQGGLTTAD